MTRRLREGVVTGLAFAVVLISTAYGGVLLRYVVFGIKYGDWMNDWLTYLPVFVQAVLLSFVGG